MKWKDYDKYSVLYLHNSDEDAIVILECKNNKMKAIDLHNNWDRKIQSTNLDDAKVEAEKYVTETLEALA